MTWQSLLFQHAVISAYYKNITTLTNNCNFLQTWELFSIYAKKENFSQLNGSVRAMGDLLSQNNKRLSFVIFCLLFYPREETVSIQKAAVF